MAASVHPRVVYTHYKYALVLLKCKINIGQMSVSDLFYDTTFSNSGADFARKSAFLSNPAGSPVQPLLKMGLGMARTRGTLLAEIPTLAETGFVVHIVPPQPG